MSPSSSALTILLVAILQRQDIFEFSQQHGLIFPYSQQDGLTAIRSAFNNEYVQSKASNPQLVDTSVMTRRLPSQNSGAELIRMPGRIEEVSNEDQDHPSNNWSGSSLPNYDSYIRTERTDAVESVSRSPSISSRHSDDFQRLSTNKDESDLSFHHPR